MNVIKSHIMVIKQGYENVSLLFCFIAWKRKKPCLGDWFYKSSTQVSSNYGIDKSGRVGMYVEEKNRSWCTSSNANDQRAIAIECASDTVEPYTMYEVVYARLIDLCVDICKRNGKKKLLWFGDKLLSA